MKLHKLKLLRMPIPEFAATQLGIGVGRTVGSTVANVGQLFAESGIKSFVKDGQLKPFHEGAMHLASRIGAFAKAHPSYMAAGGLGAVGAVKTWNVLSKPFYPKPKPKLTLAQSVQKGIKNDVHKLSQFVFKHPLAAIAGLGGAAIIANKLAPAAEEPKK